MDIQGDTEGDRDIVTYKDKETERRGSKDIKSGLEKYREEDR